ncbi:hypothetical protein EDC01DRAFT_642659 [Geopyxis carbonaria]|nr:hypothetical protein EDC01DRAFT_642659 [Geopyxis carbonaria]
MKLLCRSLRHSQFSVEAVVILALAIAFSITVQAFHNPFHSLADRQACSRVDQTLHPSLSIMTVGASSRQGQMSMIDLAPAPELQTTSTQATHGTSRQRAQICLKGHSSPKVAQLQHTSGVFCFFLRNCTHIWGILFLASR